MSERFTTSKPRVDRKNGGEYVVLYDGKAWAGDLRCDDADAVKRIALFMASGDLLEACQNFVYGKKDARECEAEMRAAIAKTTAVPV
jgi:hypothetical protein